MAEEKNKEEAGGFKAKAMAVVEHVHHAGMLLVTSGPARFGAAATVALTIGAGALYRKIRGR